MMGNKKERKNGKKAPSVGTCALICHSSQSMRSEKGEEGETDGWIKGILGGIGENERERKTG